MAWDSRVRSRIQTGFEDGAREALSQNPTQLTLEVTHIDVTKADSITTSLDKQLVRIRKIFAAGNPSSETKHIFEEYTLKNEKYGRLPDDALAWVVPKDVRLQICRLCHDNVEHLSVQETQAYHQKLLVSEDTKIYLQYVKAYLSCVHYKHASEKRQCRLNTIEQVPISYISRRPRRLIQD